MDVALGLAGVSEISGLTGGGGGTASELIGKLIEQTRDLPATEAQVNLIEKLAEQNKKSLSEVLTSVGAKDISELTKSDASEIISKMKGRRRSSSRKRRS